MLRKATGSQWGSDRDRSAGGQSSNQHRLSFGAKSLHRSSTPYATVWEHGSIRCFPSIPSPFHPLRCPQKKGRRLAEMIAFDCGGREGRPRARSNRAVVRTETQKLFSKYRRQDLNLHARRAIDPKSIVSANSTTPASVRGVAPNSGGAAWAPLAMAILTDEPRFDRGGKECRPAEGSNIVRIQFPSVIHIQGESPGTDPKIDGSERYQHDDGHRIRNFGCLPSQSQ